MIILQLARDAMAVVTLRIHPDAFFFFPSLLHDEIMSLRS